MELYLGGADNGKLQYVYEQLTVDSRSGSSEWPVTAEGATAGMEDFYQAKVIHGLHLWIRREVLAGSSNEEIADKIQTLVERNPNGIIIMDEVGCGIVPMDAMDRRYRELAGRMGCMLAERATKVVRIQFGLPQILKPSGGTP